MNSEQAVVANDGNATREARGWLSLLLLMVLFPLLFFLCVFFPIWLGVTVS